MAGFSIGSKVSEFWAIKDSNRNLYANISYGYKSLILGKRERCIYNVYWKPTISNIARSEKGCRSILFELRDFWKTNLKSNEYNITELTEQLASIPTGNNWIESNIAKCVDENKLLRHLLGPDIILSNVTVKTTVTEQLFVV